MRAANLNTLYSRHSLPPQQAHHDVSTVTLSAVDARNHLRSTHSPRHVKRLMSRTSCASCYCYVYFQPGAVIDHARDELCTKCCAAPHASQTGLSLNCRKCGDTLCPLRGHTSDAQRQARLCTDCFGQGESKAADVQYRTPTTLKPHESCAVCLEPHACQASVQLECDHVFHHACINQWLNKCGTCPLCRQVVCE